MKRKIGAWVAVISLVVVASSLAQAETNLVVRSDSDCPSGQAVTEALLAIRPDREWPVLTATIQVSEDRMQVVLGEDRNNQREIPAPADCAERATRVALVIAVWSGELPAQATGAPSLSASVPAPALTVARPAPVPVPAQKSPNVFELDGAAFYSPLWGQAAGAWLGLGRTPRKGGVGVRVLAAYQSGRNLSIEGGTNQVRRFLVGAAVTYHLQLRRAFGSGDGGLVGTLTHAQGAGYDTNRADDTMNFGGIVDLRAGLCFGRLRLWWGARLLRLVHGETVKVQSITPTVANRRALNAWDAQFGVGLGFRFE
jgi:hypothetical protein